MTKEHIFVRDVTAEFEKLNPEPAYLGLFFRSVIPPGKVDEPERGFARSYGQKAAHEDIATILELLFRGESAVQRRLALEDSILAPSGPWHGVLRKKIAAVKSIIEKKVSHMDEQFWQDVQTPKMRDPIAYWNGRGVL